MINKFGAKRTMKKPTFVKKLSEYWYEGLSEINIVSGFTITEMYPVHNKKNPPKRVDMRLLSQYNKQVAAGKQEDSKEDFTIAISSPFKVKEKIDFSTKASIECSNDDYPSNLGINAPQLLDETSNILNETGKTCYCNKLSKVPAPSAT